VIIRNWALPDSLATVSGGCSDVELMIRGQKGSYLSCEMKLIL